MSEMSAKQSKFMDAFACALDDGLNGRRGKRKTGFVLMVFPIQGDGPARCDYVSNCDPEVAIALMQEIVDERTTGTTLQ